MFYLIINICFSFSFVHKNVKYQFYKLDVKKIYIFNKLKFDQIKNFFKRLDF